MKYKKRSLKKKQRPQQQRHRFSKKYVQRGGGFMDVITAGINAMEGRTHTCMAVHPTEPLVVVGDGAGTVTLWEINYLDPGQAPPKKLAQLIGLPTAVKCVEFNKTFPLVAAACNDIVLMWRFDQISREQEQQQVEPSHMVSDFRMRNETEVEQELRAMEQNLEEDNGTLKATYREQVTIENNLRDIDRKRRDINDGKGMNGYAGYTPGADKLEKWLVHVKRNGTSKEVSDTLTKLEPLRQELKELQAQEDSMEIRHKELKTLSDSINTYDKETKIRELDRELKLIRTGARNEVSCIAFRPGSVNRNTMSYIAVGVNNDKNKTENRIIIYRFEIESSSVEKLYSLLTILEGEPKEAHPDVSLMSFSHNGALFAFVTKSSDGGPVLKVITFKGSSGYYFYEFRVYKIDQHATSIMSYKSYYSGRGEDQHQFIIGCDNGSLLMTQATTVSTQGFSVTSVTDLKSIREWNAGEEPIKCVAVHPSLPLFANGSHTTAKLWDIDQREPLESLALQDVISVGFNQKFLAVCGPGSMRFYSCNSDDYGVVKEELHKKMKIGSEIANYGTELALANRQGDPCSICSEPMNNPLTQPALRSGPEDAVEEYLGCGHKFHNKCIGPWIKKGKPCPLCRAEGGLVQATPQRIIEGRQKKLIEQAEQGAHSVGQTLQDRSRRFLDFGQGTPVAASTMAVPASQDVAAAVAVPASQEPAEPELTLEELRAARLKYFSNPPPGSQGGRRNKLKKTKKSKIRNYYSKKNKKY